MAGSLEGNFLWVGPLQKFYSAFLEHLNHSSKADKRLSVLHFCHKKGLSKLEGHSDSGLEKGAGGSRLTLFNNRVFGP